MIKYGSLPKIKKKKKIVMASIDHTHIYVYYKIIGDEEHYKCDDPHCTHFAPVSLIVDKASICSLCRQRELILTKETLRRVRPRCIECSETKEAKTFRRNRDFMDNLLNPPVPKPPREEPLSIHVGDSIKLEDKLS